MSPSNFDSFDTDLRSMLQKRDELAQGLYTEKGHLKRKKILLQWFSSMQGKKFRTCEAYKLSIHHMTKMSARCVKKGITL